MTAHVLTLDPGTLAETSAVTVTLLEPVGRFSLRAREADIPALSKALGTDLPQKIGVRAGAGTTEILCLGPDEWQLLCAEADVQKIGEACAAIYAEVPHSLTEISDRELTVRIAGEKASELLTLGCPRDIDLIPEGEGRRTLMDGATVVLWRDGAEDFRIDMWRSFAPHVIALLMTGSTELAAE